MLMNAFNIYCGKIGVTFLGDKNVTLMELMYNINEYINDDYFDYKIHTFVCHDIAELPDFFMLENNGDEFLVYERIIDDFCCISKELYTERSLFLGKKIIVITSEPKSTDANHIYNIIKNKLPNVNLFFIPLVVFSLLLPFYSNLFNSRLVYSTSLISVIYITVFFIFFAFLEKVLRGWVYQSVAKINHENSIKLSSFLVYMLSVSKDNTAPATCRTIELSTIGYWKSVTASLVDIALFAMFSVCIILMLGKYSILLLLYYLFFYFLCISVRFKSYENTLRSIQLSTERFTDYFSLHSNRTQTNFMRFDSLRIFLFTKNCGSEKSTLQLDMHNHHWGELLKLNNFISMVVMYIACYLAINAGNLSIASIIAVMIVSSRLSASLIGSVNGIYNIKVHLHQIKLSLLKLINNVDSVRCRTHLENIEQVTLENVTIEPHGKATLSDYNGRFASGDIVTVSGKVGAGKSTLLRSLAATSEMYRGTIRYNQVNICNINRMTFEKEVAFYDASCRFFTGSLRFNFNLHGIYSNDRIFEILKECCPGLALDSRILDECDADSLNLSAGERQKLMIAMILEKKPSLIVLDEPTSFMPDHEGLAFLQNLINSHKDAIFFIATHDQWIKQLSTVSIQIAPEALRKKIFINTPRPGS
ncbi:ATP-binding cassette domain-containing protein [Enterobacter cloacae]|uniref:ATP-binding cassette domain-containing protein n=1 Tax=Enterobacter cloacae TaxID=550 RepID=UPI000B8D5E73|nr:ATP-binding cassette domain-containing protein [Enterobacter cloacae]ASQ15844.1 putative ABC transporter ATP-binding protein [Enterobacter cloacae]